MRKSAEARFWSKVNKTDTCWLWTASLCGGYGTFRLNGPVRKAHRVSYEMAFGPIADGLVIDHLCRVKRCVNPEHLEAVTHRENTLRGIGPAALHAVQTHCLNGHPFSPENTWMSKAGGRYCRTCNIARGRARQAALVLARAEARARS